jgi:hypothetical protein
MVMTLIIGRRRRRGLLSFWEEKGETVKLKRLVSVVRNWKLRDRRQ